MNSFQVEFPDYIKNGEYDKAYDKLKEIYNQSFKQNTQNDRANLLNILMEKYNKQNESEKLKDIIKIAFLAAFWCQKIKLINISKDNKDVIIGKARDDTKEFNKDVIVLGFTWVWSVVFTYDTQ